ncbi:probable peroxisomal membrane protein PEX13 isoform X1 [Anopheles merus]|uniref:Uncharacterized protein n=1 Tax=Anopheles merus TaxID=30066 RepID=A0A182V0P3_ANOME|nr:probable peroxisomal membrane protein PEX13 isoform X1 [Anopheles merus]
MRTLYTIYFLLAASFFAGIVIAGVLQLSKDQQQAKLEASAEVAVRSKRELLRVLGGGFGGASGANAASNALSQNVGGIGFSSSNANANAFNQQFGLGGFGSSAANAQAQSFQSDGPFGSFGASAANSASQGFGAGPGGLAGSAGFSGSQTYNLPGGRKISIAYSNGFSLANGGRPTGSNGFSITQS